MNLKVILLSLAVLFAFSDAIAKDKKKKNKKQKFVFTDVYNVKTTPVKDQESAGTCWAYATTSFIETELLRNGKEELDLSEMHIVRNAYETKGNRFVRFHGKVNFSQGGQAHDVLNELRLNGIVLEKDYKGLNYGTKGHRHGEFEKVLSSFLQGVIKNRNKKLTPAWKPAFDNIISVYLGKEVKTFTYKGKEYTPQSFLKDYLKFDVNDYVEITSYSHHPFYSKFVLEIPDNWSHDSYYNVPLKELMEIMDNALKNNYSVCWDGCLGPGFSHRKGYAILPEKMAKNMADSEISKWEDMSKVKKEKTVLGKEPFISQEYRQKAFDNWTSTDDHLMHLTGKVKDQNGKFYYKTKNSWNTDSNKSGGYLNMSEQFVRLNTVAILVNKKAIPQNIAKKLGIK